MQVSNGGRASNGGSNSIESLIGPLVGVRGCLSMWQKLYKVFKIPKVKAQLNANSGTDWIDMGRGW